MRLWACVAAVLALSCVTARAAPSVVDCAGLAPDEPCKLFDTGTRSAEEYAQRGTDLFRLTARYALFGRDVAMEVVSAPEGGHRLRIRDPLDVGEGVQVSLGDKDAGALLEIWSAFAARLAALDFAARKAQSGLCTDGGMVQIDLSQQGVARHVLLDDCLVPESEALVQAFSSRAFALMPLCAGFGARPYPSCLRLDGDKLAAATVARTWQSYRTADCSDAGALKRLYAPPLDVVIDGATGGTPQALCQLAHAADVARFEGAGDRVVVTGRILSEEVVSVGGGAMRSTDKATAFTQIWRRDAQDRYRLSSWTIGKAVAVPSWF
jgi:hypothetical protein